jgi:hypothetical protein
MTPKKNIVRRPTYTLPDGTPLTASCLGPGFTMKEAAFIVWYSYPGTEAFMNSGRAAARAGYKGNAVMQGYLLKQKPRIAEKINSLLVPIKDQLREAIWRIAFLCSDRMLFNIADFYRLCKRIIKVRGKETEIDSLEIVPLDELTWRQRICIDGIEFRGPHSIPIYKLPNREKAYKTFMQCYKILIHEKDGGKMDWKKTAEIIRGNSTA